MYSIKFTLLLFVAVLALFFGRWGISDERAIWLFIHTAYWVVAFNFCFFVYFIFRSYRWDLLKFDVNRALCGSFVIGGCMFYISSFEEAGFKTVMDEHLIASTSQRVHLDRTALTTTRMDVVGGELIFAGSSIDKRPVLFPYLVSVLHDFVGYHPERSIHLNVYILTPILFGLLYLLGSRLGGAWGGGLLCILIVTIPLCGFVFRGGGLELLNLVLLVTLVLLCLDFWEKPSGNRCGALCLCATLLAHTRYESIIFVFAVGLLLVSHWLRIRKVQIYWPLIVIPLFLIPCLWQNRVFAMDDSNWQLEGKDVPFSLSYLPENFERSLSYFFDFGDRVPNSWLLAIGGAVSLLCLSLVLLRMLRERRIDRGHSSIALLLSGSGFLLLYLLLLCYSWEFGGAVVQRLCLPLYLPMALCLVILLARVGFTSRWLQCGSVGVLVLYVIGYALPVSADRSYDMGVGWREYAWIEQMFDSGALDTEGLYITENTSFYSVYGYSCLSPGLANANQLAVFDYLQQVVKRPMYTSVRYRNDGQGWRNEMYSSLDSAFQLDPFLEHYLSPDRKVVFYRVIGVAPSET